MNFLLKPDDEVIGPGIRPEMKLSSLAGLKLLFLARCKQGGRSILEEGLIKKKYPFYPYSMSSVYVLTYNIKIYVSVIKRFGNQFILGKKTSQLIQEEESGHVCSLVMVYLP